MRADITGDLAAARSLAFTACIGHVARGTAGFSREQSVPFSEMADFINLQGRRCQLVGSEGVDDWLSENCGLYGSLVGIFIYLKDEATDQLLNSIVSNHVCLLSLTSYRFLHCSPRRIRGRLFYFCTRNCSCATVNSQKHAAPNQYSTLPASFKIVTRITPLTYSSPQEKGGKFSLQIISGLACMFAVLMFILSSRNSKPRRSRRIISTSGWSLLL